MLMYKQKAAYNDGMASRYQAAVTRLRMFEEKGPPENQPLEQNVRMRLEGGRTGKRAVICEQLELTGLMKPFDLEVWYGERVAVLGSNGSGKSHFLRLLAAGGTDPDVEHRPVGEVPIEPVEHTGRARLGARVRPGWFVQTHEHPELIGRTLLEILHRGDAPSRRDAARAGRAGARPLRAGVRLGAEVRVAVGRPAGAAADPAARALRVRPCCCSTSRPTTSTSSPPRRSRRAWRRFEGTVIAVTHDRWFARGFDRFLVFGADGSVYESDEPVWDEGRVPRAR